MIAGPAVRQADIADIFGRIDHAAEIGQTNGSVVPVDDHQILVFFGLEQADPWRTAEWPILSFQISPFGLLALALGEESADLDPGRRCSCETGCGFTSTRTAGSELPPTLTWPTPLTWDSFCANTDDAMSYSCSARHDVGLSSKAP